MSDNLLKTLGQKLGISSPSTYSKASELQRLLSTKSVKTPSASCEAVICLHIAASLTRETYDKASTSKLSGLTASKYRSQYQAFSRVLGVDQRVTIHDLAISHGAMLSENLAHNILKQYSKDVQGVDSNLPLFQCAALYAACKQMKVKLDKKKLYDTAGSQKKVFDNLVDKLMAIAIKIESNKSKPVTETQKTKRTKTLMDLVEDNLSTSATNDKENHKRMKTKEVQQKKSIKSEEEINNEDYELWKKKILEEAAAEE